MRAWQSWAAIAVAVALIVPLGCGSRITPETAAGMNTYALQTAVGSSTSTEDAAFLFLAAQMRYKIDRQVYPPAKSGADDPAVLKSALDFSLGQAILPRLAADPTARTNALARLAKWTPAFPIGYDPGWEYTTSLDAKATAAVVAAVRQEVLGPLQANATLMENEQYARLVKELAAARAEFQRIQSLTIEKQQPLAGELWENYKQASEKIRATALRMKEMEFQLLPDSRWHKKVGWKAEDYFQDPQVVALCRAVEDDDLKKMEQLIAAGANVNAVGKNGMTPLLWAFPDLKIERFKCLLEHGANPNLPITGDLGVKNEPLHPSPDGGPYLYDRGCRAGQTVMLLACRSPETAYLRLVLEHGGDTTQADKESGQAPLDIVINRYFNDVRDRVELLLKHHADPNHYCPGSGAYPAMRAVQENKYDVALLLLKSGADPDLYPPESERKLIHLVWDEQQRMKDYPPALVAEFQTLLAWLEQHGQSLKAAEADEAHWAELYKKAFVPEQVAKVRQSIIAERNNAMRDTKKGKDDN